MDDEQLARLLSGRNEPSVLQKEREFEQVMRDVGPGGVQRRGRVVAGLATAAAAAALLWTMTPLDSAPPEDQWTVRGATDQGRFEIHCKGAGPRCQAGATLLFEVHPSDDAPHFAAFAQRDDGTVIWYMPSPEGRSPAVDTQTPLLPTGIVLGPEHPPGVYTVYGAFSAGGLTRQELKHHLGDDLGGDAQVRVVRKTMTVEGRP